MQGIMKPEDKHVGMTYEIMAFGELGESMNLHLTSSLTLMCLKKMCQGSFI